MGFSAPGFLRLNSARLGSLNEKMKSFEVKSSGIHLKRRQFAIFSFAIVVALSAFVLFFRSAMSPRYSRSEIFIGEKLNHKLIVSYPTDWFVESAYDGSIILSHCKPSKVQLAIQLSLPWFFHSDWDSIKIAIQTQNLGNNKSIDENLTELKLSESSLPQNGYLFVLKDYNHPFGKGVEEDFSSISKMNPEDSDWYVHGFVFFCHPAPQEVPIQILVSFNSKASMKSSLDAVAKDILSRMKIEPKIIKLATSKPQLRDKSDLKPVSNFFQERKK